MQGTRHKVSGPLTRDVGYKNMKYKLIATASAMIAIGIFATGCGNATNTLKRGDALFQSKHYKEAIEQFNKTIEIDPSCASAYSLRGICYWNLKEPSKATEDLERALSLGDKEPHTFYFCAWAYGLQSNDVDSLRILNEAIEAHPAEPNGYFFRACAYYELADDSKALADLDKAIELKPDHPKVAMLRSKINARAEEQKISQQSGPAYPPQGVGSADP